MGNKIKFDFLKSAINYTNVEDILDWVKLQNEAVNVNVKKIPFQNLEKWHFDDESGSLMHDSGKFFSIQGIKVNSSLSPVYSWDQPIIDQPEIGYLGFIVKKINNILHFLIQAKVEPGNINYVQLSPTLQATKSNFEQVHKGKKPSYIDVFKNAQKENILLEASGEEETALMPKFYSKSWYSNFVPRENPTDTITIEKGYHFDYIFFFGEDGGDFSDEFFGVANLFLHLLNNIFPTARLNSITHRKLNGFDVVSSLFGDVADIFYHVFSRLEDGV